MSHSAPVAILELIFCMYCTSTGIQNLVFHFKACSWKGYSLLVRIKQPLFHPRK
uniref:Uncharacterized protein n=1 Tax=Arundo donax TaxID=35708 RepID=A0A0A9EQF4_ARUDO